jgi:hypothetical protein
MTDCGRRGEALQINVWRGNKNNRTENKKEEYGTNNTTK